MGRIKPERRWLLISRILRDCPSGSATVTAMFSLLSLREPFTPSVMEPILQELMAKDGQSLEAASRWERLQQEYELWSAQKIVLKNSALEAIHAIEFDRPLPDYLTVALLKYREDFIKTIQDIHLVPKLVKKFNKQGAPLRRGSRKESAFDLAGQVLGRGGGAVDKAYYANLKDSSRAPDSDDEDEAVLESLDEPTRPSDPELLERVGPELPYPPNTKLNGEKKPCGDGEESKYVVGKVLTDAGWLVGRAIPCDSPSSKKGKKRGPRPKR